MTVFSTGAKLTDEHIQQIADIIGNEKDNVVAMWHESMPWTWADYTMDERLEFIIAAIPNCAQWHSDFVAETLLKGPGVVTRIDAPYTVPNVAKSWAETYPESMHKVAQFYAKCKSVPDRIKSCEPWLCVCALADMKAWAETRGSWPQGITVSPEVVNDLFTKWLREWR